MVILVIAFGLFDIWIDFRKRIAGNKRMYTAVKSQMASIAAAIT